VYIGVSGGGRYDVVKEQPVGGTFTTARKIDFGEIFAKRENITIMGILHWKVITTTR
jgi:hypothetical protein